MYISLVKTGFFIELRDPSFGLLSVDDVIFEHFRYHAAVELECLPGGKELLISILALHASSGRYSPGGPL